MEAGLRLQEVQQCIRGLLLVRQRRLQLTRLTFPAAFNTKACVTFCFFHRYINALEAASARFASNTTREMLRGEEDLTRALANKRRHSNSEYFVFFSYISTHRALLPERLPSTKNCVDLKNIVFGVHVRVSKLCNLVKTRLVCMWLTGNQSLSKSGSGIG